MPPPPRVLQPMSCVYNNVCCYEPCRSCVRIVTSDRAGMGKSLYIKRLREALETQSSVQPLKVVVPMHGPVVTADTVMKALEKHFGKESATIFHLDIAPSVCYYIIVLCCITRYLHLTLCYMYLYLFIQFIATVHVCVVQSVLGLILALS